MCTLNKNEVLQKWLSNALIVSCSMLRSHELFKLELVIMTIKDEVLQEYFTVLPRSLFKHHLQF